LFGSAPAVWASRPGNGLQIFSLVSASSGSFAAHPTLLTSPHSHSLHIPHRTGRRIPAMATTPPPPTAAAALEKLSSTKMFGGHNLRFRHQSATLGCAMSFSVYLPPSPASNLPVRATPFLTAAYRCSPGGI
jgi:hypothetical protein